jgi:general nucleoside transport system permease protein
MIQNILVAAVTLATPLLLASMGGLLNRLGGIVNIGLEAMILVGAFVGVAASAAAGSWSLALAAAAGAGGVCGLLFSWSVTRLGANEIIAGLGLNILVAGVIGYLLKSVMDVSGTWQPEGLVRLPELRLPLVDALPVLGPIVSGKDPVTYFSWILIPLTAFVVYRSRWGLRLRAAGAAEDASRSLGLKPLRTRDVSTVLAGALSGLAGAQLSLGLVGLFNDGMVAGRGFIALAAFYFGRSRPWPTAAGAVLFAIFDAAQLRLQGQGVSPELVQMLPYLVVVAVLTATAIRASRGRSRRLVLP